MRNIREYPITKDEIVECLKTMVADLKQLNEDQMACGDMRPLLLQKAIDIILTGKFDPT